MYVQMKPLTGSVLHDWSTHLHPLPVALLRLECGSNLTPLDLAKDDSWIFLNRSNNLRVTLGGIARSRAARIKPIHEAALVPPNRHCQNHASCHGLAHTFHSSKFHECIRAVLSAVCVVDRARDIDGCVFDDFAVLHVFADHLLEDTVLGWELGDDSEWL
jgi:hypothetical protein